MDVKQTIPCSLPIPLAGGLVATSEGHVGQISHLLHRFQHRTNETIGTKKHPNLYLELSMAVLHRLLPILRSF